MPNDITDEELRDLDHTHSERFLALGETDPDTAEQHFRVSDAARLMLDARREQRRIEKRLVELAGRIDNALVLLSGRA